MAWLPGSLRFSASLRSSGRSFAILPNAKIDDPPDEIQGERFVQGKRAYEGRRRPKGLFVACAGSSRNVVFDPARHVVKALFAAIDYEYVGEVFLDYTDDPNLGPRKESALVRARTAGESLGR